MSSTPDSATLDDIDAKVRAALAVTIAIGEAIRDLKHVPSGHLYAQVMHQVSLESYNRTIDALVRMRIIRRDPNHMLTWIG